MSSNNYPLDGSQPLNSLTLDGGPQVWETDPGPGLTITGTPINPNRIGGVPSGRSTPVLSTLVPGLLDSGDYVPPDPDLDVVSPNTVSPDNDTSGPDPEQHYVGVVQPWHVPRQNGHVVHGGAGAGSSVDQEIAGGGKKSSMLVFVLAGLLVLALGASRKSPKKVKKAA